MKFNPVINYSILVLTVLPPTLFSCKGGSSDIPIAISTSITKNEKKGISDVVSFYGGKCVYSKGVNSSTLTGTINYFELEVSNSREIEGQSSIPKLPASNIAYLFFKNLKEERANYDQIVSTIKLNDGTIYSYSYDTDTLQLVCEKMEVVYRIVGLIKEKKYEVIKSELVPDSAFYLIDKEVYVNDMKSQDQEYGDIKEFEPWGFRFQKLKTGRELLHISGSIIRTNKNHQFSIDVDADPKNNEVVHIRYKI